MNGIATYATGAWLIDNGIMTDKYILLVDDQYRGACRGELVDDSMLSWGHGGNVQVLGRIVVKQQTLGM